MSKADKPDPSKLMATKMLQGWSLLGDHCDICFTPLMRSKDKKIIHCVTCSADVITTKQAVDMKLPTTKIAGGAEESKVKEVEVKVAAVKPATAPVPKVNESNDIVADVEDEFDDDYYYADWVPPTEEELVEIAKKREKTDKAVKSMGGKLLLGWKMLNDVCNASDCDMPLLENKEGKLFCCKCEKFISVKEEAENEGDDVEIVDAAVEVPAVAPAIPTINQLKANVEVKTTSSTPKALSPRNNVSYVTPRSRAVKAESKSVAPVSVPVPSVTDTGSSIPPPPVVVIGATAKAGRQAEQGSLEARMQSVFDSVLRKMEASGASLDGVNNSAQINYHLAIIRDCSITLHEMNRTLASMK